MSSYRVRLFFCLLLALAFVSSACLSISLPASGDQKLGMAGRHLMSVGLLDYDDATANKGHDPPRGKRRRAL